MTNSEAPAEWPDESRSSSRHCESSNAIYRHAMTNQPLTRHRASRDGNVYQHVRESGDRRK